MRSSSPEIHEVASLLAKRAAVVRMIPPTPMKKQAVDQPEVNWLTHLGQTLIKTAVTAPKKDWFTGLGEHSSLTTGLVGGLGGAALGGLGGLLTTSEEDEENKWRNAMTGALAGGALGGGLGAATPSLANLRWSQQLESAANQAKKEMGGPGLLGQGVGTGMDAAWSAAKSPYVLAGGAQQLHRHGIYPGGTSGGLGRFGSGLISPADIHKLSETPITPGMDVALKKQVESAKTFVANTAGTATPSLDDFEKKLKGDKLPRLTRQTAGGAPYLRKENWFGRLLGNREPYSMPGRTGSRIRGGAGLGATLGAVYLAKLLLGKAIPSQAEKILEQVNKQREEVAGF